MASETSPEPTTPQTRMVALDALRGFALLGILIVNILSFSGISSTGQEWTGAADQAVLRLIQIFVSSKFLSLFAMLFGIGFAIQISRLKSRTNSYSWIYGRRLLILFGIGAIHLLLDPAEVLAVYSICGGLLLLFRHSSAKVLVFWALLLMTLPHLHTAIVSTPAWAEAFPEPQQNSQQIWNPYAEESGINARSQGNLSDVLSSNLQFTVTRFTSTWVSYLWMSVPLPLMIIGYLIGRQKILERIDDQLFLLRKAFLYGLATGVAGTLFGLALFDRAALAGWNPWIAFAGSLFYVFSACLMAIAYGAGIVLVAQRNFESRIFASLQAVGQMALTNYLLQTLISTTLFYNYGLGWYGKFGPSVIVLIAIAIYLFQVAVSMLWVRRFRFGPAEWIWRSLTYGHRQPMLIHR